MSISRRQLFGSAAALATTAILPKALGGKQVFQSHGATTLVIPGNWPVGKTLHVMNLGRGELVIFGKETLVVKAGASVTI